MQYLSISNADKIKRLLWYFVWTFLFKLSPVFAHRWRIFILNCFGAKVSYKSFIYPDVKIWAPWNLEMLEDSTLAFGVICYNPALVKIGKSSTVSQYTHICTAGHDYEHPNAKTSAKFPLVVGPITIGDHVWVTANCFISPDVVLEDWSVVLPKSLVTTNVPESMVFGGCPARQIKKRVIRDA